MRLLVLTTLLAAAVWAPTGNADPINGTSGDDTLVGTAGDDVIRGFEGNDVIDGAGGRDLIDAGPGNDVIRTRDSTRDVIRCGGGSDRAYSDRNDVLYNCEARPVFRVNRSFNCRGHVNKTLVKVTMRRRVDDAIHLRPGCTGRIERIEVHTRTADGVKINAEHAPAPHDISIRGGYIRCHRQARSVHQDGVQAMGGRRITFSNVDIRCRTAGNAQFFVQAAVGGYPRAVVCVRCFLGGGAATTLRVERSRRSGARDSTICRGRYFATVFTRAARSPVNTGNTVLNRSNRRC
jgi:RTX calcium-binding nonapeptide repeat (4 copies)